MKRKKRNRMRKSNRSLRKKTLLPLTLALIFSLGSLVLAGQREKEQKVYYECVQIHKGDTLWKIAEKYKAETENTEHMIDKILYCNNMKTANIQYGQKIIVPITAEI